MAGKQFQFGLATLVWLVVGSALVFGTLRYVRSASGEFFFIVLIVTIMGCPLLWLFTRPNPLRGRRRAVKVPPQEPAAPLDQRLGQFLSNVSPTEPYPSAGPTTVVLPTSTDGKAPRPRGEISPLLRRIRGSQTSNEQEPTN